MYSLQAFSNKPILLEGGFFAFYIKPISYNQFLDNAHLIKIPPFALQLQYYKNTAESIIPLYMACNAYNWTKAILRQSIINSLPSLTPYKGLVSLFICWFICKFNNPINLFFLLATINHLFVYFDNAIESGYTAFTEALDNNVKVKYDGDAQYIDNEIIVLMTYAKNNSLSLFGDINFYNYKDKLSYAMISSIQRLAPLRYAQALNMPLGGGEDDKTKNYDTNIQKYIDVAELLVKSFVKEGDVLSIDDWFSDATESQLMLRVGKLNWGHTIKSRQYLFFKRGYV